MRMQKWNVWIFALVVQPLPLFAAGGATVTTAAAPLTARQAVERIKQNVKCEWSKNTVDTFKEGDPDAPITGIAVTFTPTMDVLKRAAASGKNFIITHEPTYYHGQDSTQAIEGDSVLAAKRAYIKAHGLTIWRFHDHWHRMQPDGIMQGMIEKLGWADLRCPGGPGDGFVFQLPSTTLRRLSEGLREKFKSDCIRVVGDPNLILTKVAYSAGAPGSLPEIRLLQRDDIEVLIAGETREWETVEYVRDASAAGRRKALVILGHAISEEAGMDYCARWLKGFITEVPIEFIPVGEPYWSPSANRSASAPARPCPPQSLEKEQR